MRMVSPGSAPRPLVAALARLAEREQKLRSHFLALVREHAKAAQASGLKLES